MNTITALTTKGICQLQISQLRKLVAVILLSSLACISLVPESEVQAELLVDPNIVVIMTDDQRFDLLFAMPIAQQALFSKGTVFNHAYVTTPWCCPARSSFMSGGFYVHNTQLLTNGDIRFNDTETIATRLQGIGYQTALIGKYMNSYTNFAPYIPPGWTHFFGVSSFQFSIDWNDFEVGVGSSGANSTIGQIVPIQEYITTYQKDKSLEFLDSTDGNPFYLYLSTNAVHAPNTPLPQDAGLFTDFVYTGRGYNEVDISDKPNYVQENANCVPTSGNDGFRQILRSLQPVDRAIGDIVERITELGQIDNTVFIFTSDHGSMWGEHRLCHKGHPYEESLKVPFVIVVPGMAPGTSDHMISANLDLGATIYDLLSVPVTTDGASVLPLLEPIPAKVSSGASPIEQREHILIQTFKEPIWSGLVVDRPDGKWKYVERTDNERELYDLIADPFELENLQGDPTQASRLNEFAITLAAERGLSVNIHNLPNGVIEQPYSYPVSAWGGAEPYSWSITLNSAFPAGVTLDAVTGLISGVPTQSGCFSGLLRVQSSTLATHYGQPQLARLSYEFCIDDDTDADGIGDTLDNCTLVENAGQTDSNNDGFGNACDPDTDNNCVVNFGDVALFASVFLSNDADHDINGDGVVNFGDLPVFAQLILEPPGPSGLDNDCANTLSQ